MEMSQGNSLCSYPCHFSFFFYKIRAQEGGTGPSLGGSVPMAGEGGEKGCNKGELSAKTVYTCM
jgi:hypothetical protein